MHTIEDPVKVMWKKLLTLQPVMRKLSKPMIGIKNKIEKARSDLTEAQNLLVQNKMNIQKIMKVKSYTEEVTKLNDIEEQVLR